MKSRLNKKIDNEIPEGYKLTKAGIIPNEWSEMKLSQVLDKTKLGGNYENTSDSDGLPLIKMGNIGRGNIVLDNLNYIKSEEADCDDRLKEGDILFNTRNTLELVGKVAIWKNELPEAYYNSNLLMLKFKDQFVGNNYFMNYQFNSFSMVRKLRRIATGTTSVAAIYTKDLTTLSIAIPSIPEQHKIANILSTWDKAIELKEKLIEEKRKQKSGLMQKLLTGKVRLPGFDGEWALITLGDYLIKHNEKTTENNQYPVLTSSRNGIFFQKDYFDGNDVASKDNTGYNVVPRDFFTYRHMSDDLIFKFNINTIVDKGIVSTLYPVFTTNKELDSNYLKLVLNEGIEFKQHALSQKQGGSRTYMYYSKLEELEIKIPSIEEQVAISELEKLANREIELLEKEIEALKQQKKGLMQLLLTGIVRVNVETN